LEALTRAGRRSSARRAGFWAWPIVQQPQSLSEAPASHWQLDRARQELAKGTGIIKTAKLTGLGTGAVHKLRREMGAA
jgi:hypothetical protein